MVGNLTLLERVLQRIEETPGVRSAEPGEFSARAYLNNRLSLSEAEGIALRIAAVGDEALIAANKLLDGSQAIRCNDWSEELALLLALVEAGVDFTDQDDVVPIAPSELADRLLKLRSDLENEIGSASGAIVHQSSPDVVLCGQPNAGKSALFNALLERKRAVVSDQAGTTRDAISEELDLEHDIPGAGKVQLTDLAGVGDRAIDPLDESAQQLARERIQSTDAMIWCDPSGKFEDREGFGRLNKPIIRVRTKSDLIGNSEFSGDVISVCALDGSKIGVLKRAIADAIVNRQGLGVGAFVPRHRRAIASTIRGITAAIDWIDPNAHAIQSPELVASGLRDALDALGELTGEITPDDVLGRVFATFCVGK